MAFNEADTPAIGRAIYREKIHPTLGPEHKGKVVVIDVKSGDYAIADRHLDADIELRKRRPDAFTWADYRIPRLAGGGPTHADAPGDLALRYSGELP